MTPPLPNANTNGRSLVGRVTSALARRAGLYLAVVLLFLSIVVAVRASMVAADDKSVWPVIAILSALPWSLALTLLDLIGGFGDRGAWIVAVGFAVNVALLIAAGCGLVRRWRPR